MRLLKGIIFVLLPLFALFAFYVGMALASSPWYQGIDMDTPYSISYYENKINKIVSEFAVKPLDVTTFNLTEKECEGCLKLAVKMDPNLSLYVKGIGLAIQQNSIILKTNLQFGPWKKGLEITIKPYYEEKVRELAVKVEKIRLGSYPLPVSPVLYMLEKTVSKQGPIKIANNKIRLSINNMPVALKYVRIESQQLTVGLSMATGELTKIAAEDKVLFKEVFSKAVVLQNGIISTQVKEFINELQQKNEILPEDIDKAKAIYNSLSPEDRSVLHQNLKTFLSDPSIKEALKKFGLQ